MGGRIILLCTLLGACGGGGGDGADAGAPDAGDCPAPAVLFMNRGGGDYTLGTEDSANNVSSIINMAQTIPAFDAMTEPQWADLVACVGTLVAPFNIQVTEVDPAPAAHREFLFGTDAVRAQIGLSAGISGVTPFTCPGPVPNPISWIFPFTPYDTSARANCELVGQMIGNTFGLDHAFSCPDLMTYLSDCGDKSYTDEDVQCGEFEARACQCGGDTQNAYQKILSLAGPACP
ncbi:MAG TPA: hypothetical protein VL172_01920 [Kofleriaceae bacterium]|jgi:hypothetical protein|nr:hypothetical protein [Kofleriaceae bacterium]